MSVLRFSKSDEDLLAECEVGTFHSSGPGGQNVNKRETAVRIRHLPTGIVVVCQEDRSQLRNRQLALKRLREELAALSKPVRPRIPTPIPAGLRRRVATYKARRAERKNLRRKPDPD
ncbi:MAG: peptide chain release factor-like protein [Candidatus Bipolaricaulota bacterium]|nr:peptide chain release factor-like protein [Candidatus Bipolaricaulota bacterium]